MKACNVCGEAKPTTEFSTRSAKCKICARAYYKAYRAANLEKEKLRDAARYRNDPARAASNTRWKKNNYERVLDHNRARRARLLGATTENVIAIVVYERDNWVCGICGTSVDGTLEFPDPGSRSIDHIIALVHGGAHSYENTQLAHLGCNTSKHAK